jgi:hypothetical protein
MLRVSAKVADESSAVVYLENARWQKKRRDLAGRHR